MSPDISTAFTLLVVGMITVFVVLTLVVITGQVLIRFVNAFVPEHIKPGNEISPETIAVITATVDQITSGQGSIKSIQKTNG